MVRGGICSGIVVQLSGEAKVGFIQDIQGGYASPYAGKYMCHVTEVALHGVLLGSRAVSCQNSHTNPVCKHLEVGYRVGDTGKFQDEGKSQKKLQSLITGGGSGAGSARTDIIMLCLSFSAVMIFRLVVGATRNILQYY